MKIIGLIGGIASGKSAVAAELERCGAGVLDADRAGHEVLKRPEIRRALVARWGDTILRADGTVDRQAVARVVFAPPPDGPAEREFLERLTHPRIREILETEIASMDEQGKPVAVLDAALLIESGWGALCDEIVFVDAPSVVRQQRAAERGWSADDFRRREAAQTSLAKKRDRADQILENGGKMDETVGQIETLWEEWAEGSGR